jgi:hypothetical protein
MVTCGTFWPNLNNLCLIRPTYRLSEAKKYLYVIYYPRQTKSYRYFLSCPNSSNVTNKQKHFCHFAAQIRGIKVFETITDNNHSCQYVDKGLR